jgi:hypothetical protein
MGAVSGESDAVVRGAVNDDLLVMADCSLVLGRRSVFILTFSPSRAPGGIRARLEPDDSTRRTFVKAKVKNRTASGSERV